MANPKQRANESSDPANDLGPDPPAGEPILVVSKRTGLPMATLRAWERRYGFPLPQRRPGTNRRLYSQLDIERLVAVKRAMESGYRVGDLLGKSLEALDALGGRSKVGGAVVSWSPPSAGETSPEDLLSMLARDEVDRLEGELRRAGAVLGPRRFVTDIAHPFASLVGSAWAAGRLSVRQEHVATECLLTRLRAQIADYQDFRGSPQVLLATLPGERHGLALQMVALYLVTAGARVRTLGVSTPVDEIVEAASVFRADVVGIAVTPVTDATETLRSVVLLRRRLDPRVSLWLGGSGAAMLGPIDGDVSLATTWNAVEEALAARRRMGTVAR